MNALNTNQITYVHAMLRTKKQKLYTRKRKKQSINTTNQSNAPRNLTVDCKL